MSGASLLVLPARGAFRLPAVAVSHGWFQTAPFAWDPEAGTLSRTERLEGGPVDLRMSADDGGVAVRAARDLGAGEREAAGVRVRRVLQLDADLTGFDAAARAVDPDLADDLAAYGGGRVLAGASLFEDVVKGICGTNTTWRQAVASINRLAELGPPDCFPGPADLLRAGEDHMRAVVRVGYRAPAILAAARAAIDGTLADIEADSAAGDGDRVHAGLVALSGIGPATAGFVILLMGHYDRPSIDSATIRVAADRWFGGARPKPREVLRRIEPAGGYRGLVLAWATLRVWQRETGLVSP
ncbi:MAG: DNA-3-methyladenine glycosylase [Thermoleophilia bacterium]